NNVVIGANSQIINSTIGEHTTINASVISDSIIGASTTVGPFAHIRMHAEIGNKARIGNFVEIKKSVFKDGAKSAHLSYIGDAELGENVNMGCGSITVNYDGKNKHKTVIGANTMVGCNVNLVAPVTVEPNAYLAAGSTITKNVPEDALAIARSKQENKEGYAKVIRQK
ncbi:MAG: DapH/DapD/GlmU-related protein, partial [Turicibacter sp.]|nr:DapH/DapD/GlmU-related protein [Turicibacter sp.]